MGERWGGVGRREGDVRIEGRRWVGGVSESSEEGGRSEDVSER